MVQPVIIDPQSGKMTIWWVWEVGNPQVAQPGKFSHNLSSTAHAQASPFGEAVTPTYRNEQIICINSYVFSINFLPNSIWNMCDQALQKFIPN